MREIVQSEFTGKDLFVNLCGSPAIEKPTDKQGSVVTMDRFSADGLSVPLVVGPPRDVEESNSIAIDVVFNPLVVEIAEKQAGFKKQIVELALDWVMRETTLRFDTVWNSVAPAKYQGGRGIDSSAPVLFFVDDDEEAGASKQNGSAAGKSKLGDPLSSTASLSSFLSGQNDQQSDREGAGLLLRPPQPSQLDKAAGLENIVVPGITPKAPKAASGAKKASLIEVIGGDSSNLSAVTDVQQVASEIKPTVPLVNSRKTDDKLTPSDPALSEWRAKEVTAPALAASATSTAEYQSMERIMERLDGDFVTARHSREMVRLQPSIVLSLLTY